MYLTSHDHGVMRSHVSKVMSYDYQYMSIYNCVALIAYFQEEFLDIEVEDEHNIAC